MVQIHPDPPNSCVYGAATRFMSFDRFVKVYWKYEGLGALTRQRGRSSAGRAPALHAGGQEFDPPRLHQFKTNTVISTHCFALSSEGDLGYTLHNSERTFDVLTPSRLQHLRCVLKLA